MRACVRACVRSCVHVEMKCHIHMVFIYIKKQYCLDNLVGKYLNQLINNKRPYKNHEVAVHKVGLVLCLIPQRTVTSVITYIGN